MTKLLDLHRAGLVDAHVYRTLPCFSLVSTGACPFGKRCTSLHPPELSNGSSWLPLTETQGNTISTDINVEALHQKRLAEITVGHDTPDLDLHRDDWNDWYRQVCNLQYTSSPSRRSLTPNIKLQIALLLRDNADWSYKFRPQHVVCNEQCMLLTEAAFFVTSHGHVQPLPLHSYRSSQPRHVHVRELAFGPDVDPSVRGVSLYFNLPLSAITVCTAQQAKRYRWKKRMPNLTTTTMTTTTTSSLLDGMDSFPMIRSHDVILFGLQTRALQHRLAVLQAENGLDLHRRHAATAQLRQVKQQLQRDWNAWKCSVQMWSWPPKRVVLDRKTPVPAVDGDYIPPETSVVASLWSTCRTAPWKESDDDGWVRLFVISLLFSSLTHTHHRTFPTNTSLTKPRLWYSCARVHCPSVHRVRPPSQSCVNCRKACPYRPIVTYRTYIVNICPHVQPVPLRTMPVGRLSCCNRQQTTTIGPLYTSTFRKVVRKRC